MSVRRLEQNQPDSFKFTQKNLNWAKSLIEKYPKGKQRSAVIPLLWRAQEQNNGWVSEPALRTVADLLDMAYIRVYEVATFYTMFQLSPVGETAHIQVCGTTPCMLRGANHLLEVCKKRIAAEPHTLSSDGKLSWEEVECLGACVNAPMIQIFKDTYEDLDVDGLNQIIDALEKGKKIKPGPRADRVYAAPEGGATTLTDVPDYKPLNLQNGATRRKANGNGKTNGVAATIKADNADKTIESNEVSAKSPETLTVPRSGNKDELTKIKGIGAVLEEKLNNLGIYHFDQIAALTPENIAWIDDKLSFKGRIEREEWLPQAKLLSEGRETEFSKRVEAGDVPTSKSKEDE